MNEFTEAALEAAGNAGKILEKNFRGQLDVEYKGAIDLVTQMDKKSEKMITDFLRNRFPRHDVVSEEGTVLEEGSKYIWYIDPLDGTTNYAHGLPWYAVSIGLLRDGNPTCGVIFNPSSGEMFYGEEGGGAFLNGKKIKISTEANIDKALLTTGFPYYLRERPDRVTRNFNRFLTKCQGVRRYGAAALDLAYVAAGFYEGFWEEGLKPWDTAAGILILKEAGGKVSDYGGKEYSIFKDTIVASNGLVHDRMLEILEDEEN